MQMSLMNYSRFYPYTLPWEHVREQYVWSVISLWNVTVKWTADGQSQDGTWGQPNSQHVPRTGDKMYLEGGHETQPSTDL